jgi:hypothetical protein
MKNALTVFVLSAAALAVAAPAASATYCVYVGDTTVVGKVVVPQVGACAPV